MCIGPLFRGTIACVVAAAIEELVIVLRLCGRGTGSIGWFTFRNGTCGAEGGPILRLVFLVATSHLGRPTGDLFHVERES